VLTWQRPADETLNRTWDVAIVGCGPAGAIAALHLARRGFRVVAFERDAFPRDKVCGDALIPDALRALERAGLLGAVRARSFEGRRHLLYSPSRVAADMELNTLVIKRMDLDVLLAHAAAEAGAVIARGDVESVDVSPDSIRLLLRGVANPVRAHILLLATGADVRLLGNLGMLERPSASAVAVRCYIRSSVQFDDLLVSFDRLLLPGYAWIFPVAPGEYNIGCGVVYERRNGKRVNLEEKLRTFMAEFPIAREIAAGMTSMSRRHGAMLRTGLTGASVCRSPNVVAIGESIGATLPLSGEGIGKAMETSEAAATAIAAALEQNDLSLIDDYRARMATLRERFNGYQAAEDWMSHPWLADTITKLARRRPSTRRKFTEILDDTADPRTIFSISGVLRAIGGLGEE
jgi:geranylgeranyl reductase family protein